MLRDTYAAEIDTLLARYAQKRSAVLPLLYIAQDEYGYLTQDAIREVATILDMPYTDVFEVVGFYTLFYNRPMGRWVLQVCDDVPCCYLGAEAVIDGLKQRLGISEEETTADGMFTLQRVKCVAACNKAPVLQANLDYIYNLSVDSLDAMLRDLRTRADKDGAFSLSGRLSEDYDLSAEGLRQIERRMGPIPSAAPAETTPTAPEEEKAAEQEEASAPEEPAKEAAEQKMAAESPVAPSPDRSPAGQRPIPEKQDDEGAVPARAQQQEPQSPASSPVVEDTKTEATEGWKQRKPEGDEQPAAESKPTEQGDTKNTN